MSATDQMREMINQLMGTDPATQDGRERVPFNDTRVCRGFLQGCCQHEVLASTRMDLGACPRIHDVALRADFQKAEKAGTDHFYDLDALDQLERFFADCDRKTEMAKKRLEETQEELSEENQEKAEKVLELNESIGQTLADAERLGEEGRVDESLKLMEKVEELRKNKQEADSDYRNSMPASSYQQQKLRVCEVCSAYLGIHDNDRRLADHFGGKLHMGFVFLREKLAELRSTATERRVVRESQRQETRGASGSRYYDRQPRREDYRSSSHSSRDRRSRSQERDRDSRKDRDRHRGSRSDRDKDRDKRDKRRSKSRSRDRRSKEKKRGKERSPSRRDKKEGESSRKRSVSNESIESGELARAASNGQESGDVHFSDVDE